MGRLSSPAGLQGGIAQGVGGLPEFLPMNQVGNRINFLLGTAVPSGNAPWNLVGGLTVPQTTLLGVAGVGGVFDNVGYAELKANAGVADEFNQTTTNALLSPTGRISLVNTITGALQTSQSMTVTPNGKFLYVCYTGGTGIVGYKINQTTGLITSMGAAFVGSNNNGICCTNNFVFVVDSAAAKIFTYVIDGVTGALTIAGNIAAVAGTHLDIRIDPISGRFLFVINTSGNTVSSYTINSGTGIPTLVTTITTGAGTLPVHCVVTAAGTLLYTSNQTSGDIAGFKINQITGALTSVGANVACGAGPTNIIAGTNFLYVNAGGAFVQAFIINIVSGVITPVGAPVACGNGGLTITPSQANVYSAFNTGFISVFSVNATVGTLTLIQNFNVGVNQQPIAISPFGNFLFSGNSLTGASSMILTPPLLQTVLASFNITTTAATIVGTASPRCRVGLRAINGLPFDVSVDFNPSTGNVFGSIGNPIFQITEEFVTVDNVISTPIFKVVIAQPSTGNASFTPYVRPRTDAGLVGSVGVGRIQLEGTTQVNAPVTAATEFIPTYESIAARISGRIPSNNSAAAWDIRTLVGATDLSLTQIDFTRTLCLCSGTWQLTLPDVSGANIQPYLQGCQIKIVNTGVGVITVAQKNAANLIFGPGLAQAGQANFTLPYNGAATGLYNVSGVTMQLDSNQQWHVVDVDEVHGEQIFTANGNFTVPAGVTTGWIDGAAAGGGGGGSAATGIGGGGSGGQAVKDFVVALVPGAVHAVVIGVGGAGGAAGANNGIVGGNTTFGALLTLVGGNFGFGAAAGVAALGGASSGRGSGSGKFGSLGDGVGGDGGGTIFAPPNFANTNVAGLPGIENGGGGTGAGAAGGAGGQGAGNNVAGPSTFLVVRW
jgi:6-phosphogluconolactonase (cycloisomerase 2 family)